MVAAHEATLHAQGSRSSPSSLRVRLHAPRRHQRRAYLNAVRSFVDDMDSAGPRFTLLSDSVTMSSLNLGLHYHLLKELGYDFARYNAEALKEALALFLARSNDSE